MALSVVRGLVKRPRLANTVFRFEKWGNILGPDRFVDPYPIYERMRAAGPVSFSPLLQQWAVVGYEEARQVLSSSSFGVAPQIDLLLEARPYSRMADTTKALLRNALLFTDPPLHTRLRSVVNRAFTPRRMQRLEARVAELVDRLLADIADDPVPDLVPTLTEPLPIQVIAELIGVPEDRWPWVTATSATLRRVLDTFVVVDPAEIDETCEQIATYYGALADQRRAEPRDDLITTLAAAEAEGNIARAELVSLLTILLLAGHETTTGAIGNAAVVLAARSRPTGARSPEPRAVAERRGRAAAVRHRDPHRSARALEDVTIAGKTIRKGQNLTVMLGAANRDPRRFDGPDQLRLDRENPAPLSFGLGIHHCVGAALARMELRVTLPAIVDAFGDYTIDPNDVAWKTSLAFRSPTRLPVRRGK